MTRIVFDAVTVASGGTETGTHKVPSPSAGRDWTYYLDGDADSTDVTIEWRIKPRGGTQFYPLDGGTKSNADASGDLAFELDLGVAEGVEVAVTNNAAAGTTISMEADESFR